MKKGLLLATMLLAGVSAFAAKDAATYEPKNGLTFTNLSMNCDLNGDWTSLAGKAMPSLDYVRTATVLNHKVYVVSSKVFDGEGATDGGALVVFDALTGAYEKTIQLTVDGKPYSEGLLGANCIGSDYFGNLWVCGYKGTMFTTNEAGEEVANPLKVYVVDPETGAATLAAKLGLTEDDTYASGRVDFIDIAGDITREQERCVVMAVPHGDACAETYVYGWACEQGSDEWYGHMNGEETVVTTIESTALYPQLTSFRGAATAGIIYDETLDCLNLYVNDMNTCPAQVNTEGAGAYNFAKIAADESKENLIPKTNPTGCGDFYLAGNYYFMYGIEEYDGDQACRANLVNLGPNASFDDMELMYVFPEAGLGHQKGGPGARVHSFKADVVTDDNGKQGAYILTYKTGNGFGYYLLAEDGFQSGGVEAPVVDNSNAPVEYFNLQGIRVANPENGVFVRRQGSDVKKVVL